MTVYYTPTSNPPALTRGTSSPMRTEFVSIQTGFASVNTDLTAEAAARVAADALKAAKAGETYTGTHDFTAGTTKVATQSAGDNSTNAASTAFVVATSLNANLPGQGGNAGNVVTTDGATASWTPNLKATVIRFKDGTDASKLMAFDVSGVTTATTRTLAVPNKNGTLAMTSDICMTLLATLTPTAAANVDALTTFTSSYDAYLIIGEGIAPAVTDSLRLRLANAGTADAGANYYSGASSATSISITGSVLAGGGGASFQLTVINANATGTKAVLVSSTCHQDATPTYSVINTQLSYVAANAASGIRLYWNSGNNFAAAGKIRIYGITNT